MRHRSRLSAATLACAAALVGCGTQSSDRASWAGDSPGDEPVTEQSAAAANDGFLTSTEVRESPYGPEPAATLLLTYTVDGETAPGTTVVQVVPAGGHAGYPSVGGRDRVDAMGSHAATSIAQTCRFTRTGC